MGPSSHAYVGRSPEGAAMLAGSTAKHIAQGGPAGARPATREAR